MAAQKGRDMLVKIADDSGSFVTIAGLRAKTISLNAKAVDITDSESEAAWRELLPGAGVKTLEISGNGIFRDTASDAIARKAFLINPFKTARFSSRTLDSFPAVF